ncbi:MAG: universal stress protein, partial [Gemmatimonadota bacterium]|nr:universal stress protein [Gemmatimonadota bacterium]
ADARGIRTELHVVRGRDAAAAICAAAERLGVDVVCVGTHGRSGLTEAVMGSVAGAVLRCTRRPVLMVRA